jgi:uncharacterized protein (DUF1499 family)
MATLLAPTPLVTMPPDTRAALHARNAQQYSRQIFDVIRDASVGIEQLERIMDQLPDAAEALRENPLSQDVSAQWLSFVQQADAITAKLRDGAAHIRKLQHYGRSQLAMHEARLVELRLIDDGIPPADESTCNPDHDQEGAA